MGFIPSRSTKKTVDATRPANPSPAQGGEPSEGENTGVGTKYSAVLKERANKSLNRNAGPERPSANPGMIPTVSQSVRKTGRI